MVEQISRDRVEGLAAMQAEARACRRCLDAGYPITPGAVLSGPATAQIVLVGQAPGSSEVEVGRPFNGAAGRRLFRWLLEAGWQEDLFRSTQYVTAITKCYPGKGRGGKGDRVPTRAEQDLCASYLASELSLVCPQIIIPVGSLAIRYFLGRIKLAQIVGKILQRDRVWIVPLPHPSGASLWLNRPEHRDQVSLAVAHIRRLSEELGLLTRNSVER
jgi:uracil-DNA glycosylase